MVKGNPRTATGEKRQRLLCSRLCFHRHWYPSLEVQEVELHSTTDAFLCRLKPLLLSFYCSAALLALSSIVENHRC